MKNILINALISLILSVLVVVAVGYFNKTKKIGYVKSGVIINEYKEMKASNEQFSKELAIVQTNLDTLKNRYLKLKEQETSIAEKNKTDWAYQLGIAKSEYEKYEQQAEEQMQQRKEQLTKEVLNKINDLIQEYGKKNGYQLILGTTDNGSILYGNEADDLTAIILNELNEGS